MKRPARLWLGCGVLVEQLGLTGSEFDNSLFIKAKYHIAHDRRRCVVQMNNSRFYTRQSCKSTLNQGLSGRGQHLYRHVIRNEVAINQLAQKVELDLRCRWKSDLDLLEADVNQRLEHFQFARNIHWLNERLIPIAQINAAPHGWAR